jgi:hypothetical protein
MICPACGHDVPDGSAFCNACGAKLVRTCASCGATPPPGSRFCNGCGADLQTGAPAPAGEPRAYTPKHLADKILQSKSALEGERKQVTVLFADVTDSMELGRCCCPRRAARGRASLRRDRGARRRAARRGRSPGGGPDKFALTTTAARAA